MNATEINPIVEPDSEAFAAAEAFETETVHPASRKRVLALLWPLFRSQAVHFAGSLLLLVVAAGLTVAGPVLIKRAIDRDIAGSDPDGLLRTVLLFLGAQLAHLAVFYVMRNWLEWAGQNMMAALKRSLFRHLMKLPLSFFDRHPPGKLLSRVENDTEALRLVFTTTSVLLLGDLLLFAGMFVVMGIVSPRLTLVVACVLPPLGVLTWHFQRRGRPLFLAWRNLTAEMCGRLAEFLQGMSVIQAFDRPGWALRHFDEVNSRRFHVGYQGERLWLMWFNAVVVVEFVAFALILGVGGAWAMQGLLTIGTLAMFMGYVRRFFEPLMRLSEQSIQIQKALAAGERILQLLSEPVSIADVENPVPWPGLRKELRFENVWFRYDDRGEWILRDVSFVIPAGQRWALVGATGSGKTTIVSLLLRFYEPQRGRITVDGVDLHDLDQQELRSNIGLVLQDLYLFPGNLEENLTLGRSVAREELDAAVDRTQARSVIDRLSDGYAGTLAERGANLSMGERQLLSFTRAIVHEPSLLILDEATSAVDPETEARIGVSLSHILEGRTALIVAHRLSTVRSCDRILVLQEGEIVESGSHGALMRQSGLYRTLHELQFKEEGGDVVTVDG